MTFLISYELKNKQSDYRDFFARLNSVGESKQIMPNVVVLYSDDKDKSYTVNDLSDILSRGLSDVDRLVIFDVRGRRPNGLLTSEEWKWLNARIGV